MPKLDGWQVLKQLQERGAKVTVFVLSTEVKRFPAMLTQGRGAAAYLSKDEPAVLLKTIAAFAAQGPTE
jgi:DNA-binding NarL/FixJ family response regulator